MTSCKYTLQNSGSTDSSSTDKPKYMFVVEWYDPLAQIVKKFLMTFYSIDETVELVCDFSTVFFFMSRYQNKVQFTTEIYYHLYDLKNHRIFLRRCKQEGLSLENLYKSAIVTIMARQIKIIDYGDALTKHKFEKELSFTFAMIKPDVVSKVGEILTYMVEHGFKIINLKMGTMSMECATAFYAEHQKQSYFPTLLAFVTSGPCIGILALAEDGIKKWRDCIGPLDSEEAKKVAPNSLRAIYGTDVTRNGVHGSKDEKTFQLESELWFPTSFTPKKNEYIRPTCICKNTTCCIIKPHAILDGYLGPILSYMREKEFKITAMEIFTLDVSTAEEFLEVYKGVVSEYSAMVVQLTSGPCVALEIMDTKNPECSQETFRKIVGPADPELARKLRPDTIRAKFGKTKVMNAVHCTDLPDDAVLEVEYFFKVLQL